MSSTLTAVLKCSRIISLSSARIFSSKVPSTCQWKVISDLDLPREQVIEEETVAHIERLSLVEFNTEAGIESLRKAVRFADQLHLVNTDGVEPMESVLEDETLNLRDDEVTEGNIRETLLSLSKETLDDYYVSPPGNIPLTSRRRTFKVKEEVAGGE